VAPGARDRRTGGTTTGVLVSDVSGAVTSRAAPQTRGAPGVAEFSRRACAATPALLDGAAAVVWMQAGRPRVVHAFTVGDDRITAIDLIADPTRLSRLELAVLDDVG
jgi:RNA polymerase sigma-70 factor (ECF subfamily)